MEARARSADIRGPLLHAPVDPRAICAILGAMIMRASKVRCAPAYGSAITYAASKATQPFLCSNSRSTTAASSSSIGCSCSYGIVGSNCCCCPFSWISTRVLLCASTAREANLAEAATACPCTASSKPGWLSNLTMDLVQCVMVVRGSSLATVQMASRPLQMVSTSRSASISSTASCREWTASNREITSNARKRTTALSFSAKASIFRLLRGNSCAS
mmetsp:Transcript_4661/g.29453  ORF Transcript_4661/g.29453 Transcript_4661/m.29453 type:complete len:217 (+) Transcript_4661:1151-1801(+)